MRQIGADLIWHKLFFTICLFLGWGVRGVPLLHIRLAVWLHKSPNEAWRKECAFMRILLHKYLGFYKHFLKGMGFLIFAFAPNWRKVY